MKTMLGVIVFALLTAVCWGVYGPVLKQGLDTMEQGGESQNSLRAFICVGLAYFLIAVLVPSVLLQMRGEAGAWTVRGTWWSLIAGASGAAGALGVTLAFAFGGSPSYVMPLVFGGAPVVNTALTMWMGRSYKEAGPMFFAGLILVVVGAVTVLLFKPAPPGHDKGLEWGQLTGVVSCIVLALISWGVYGPVLHKGQVAMQGSRLRPLLCVGLAYFLIAVLVPAALLAAWEESGGFTPKGTLWSLGGGAAGAVGAIGIILAFNCGGKPVYIMPLVFGGAPVVNTFVSIIAKGTLADITPLFYAGLILVVAGAVTVLVFAPKGQPHAPPAKA